VNSERIRILVVDDDPLFARSLCALLEPEPSLPMVGVAANGEPEVRSGADDPCD
jgi:chemotaxis response regulator CheB